VAKEVKPELSDLGRKARELGYTETVIESERPPGAPVTKESVEPPQQNIFEAQPKDVWDFSKEIASRDGKSLYIIHYDERGESGNEEVTLTYYAGDDVLCDAQDKVVEDVDKVVGEENLDKFGHGSNDPVIVYVRNENLSIDIEVVKSEQTYAEEVHGFTHEDQPRRRRERWKE
jgi:hypothetical protein